MQTEVTVQPCFGGPTNMPKGCSKASPVYMMHDSNPSLKRRARIAIHHQISIESTEDRDNMVFLQGSNVPRNESSRMMYDFSIIQGGNASFEIGSNTGQITVDNLSQSLCIATRQQSVSK